MLNKHSGLVGISGVSSDMREVISAANSGNTNAKLALDIFCYRIKKYIGSYWAALGRLDAIVFTAGVGENSSVVRSLSCKGMEQMGVIVDEEKNSAATAREMDISGPGAKVKVLVIPTNEELVIAQDTQRIVEEKMAGVAVPAK